MKKLHKYRSVFWLLPLLIFCCTCFSGIYASGELFRVSAAMLPFSVWIAIVSSLIKNHQSYSLELKGFIYLDNGKGLEFIIPQLNFFVE